MKNILNGFLEPIAAGLDKAGTVMSGTVNTAALRLREFAEAPWDTVSKNPISAVLATIGGYIGVSTAMAWTTPLIGAALSPIAIPVGVGIMALNVAGFGALIFGGIETVKTAATNFTSATQNMTGASFEGIKNTINKATPGWMKKKPSKEFEVKAAKTDPKADKPAVDRGYTPSKPIRFP